MITLLAAIRLRKARKCNYIEGIKMADICICCPIYGNSPNSICSRGTKGCVEKHSDEVAEKLKVSDAQISREELHEICELTAKLTELRQNECKHLSVESFSVEIFGKLLSELSIHKKGSVRIHGAYPYPRLCICGLRP
jgi:hypothetical protein